MPVSNPAFPSNCVVVPGVPVGVGVGVLVAVGGGAGVFVSVGVGIGVLVGVDVGVFVGVGVGIVDCQQSAIAEALELLLAAGRPYIPSNVLRTL